MKAALLYGKDDLRVVDIERPKIGSTEILLEVKACAVCPTDVRKYRVGDHEKLEYPINLGHEWSGIVVEVGEKVKNIKVGDRLASTGLCLGGYAEYIKIPGLSFVDMYTRNRAAVKIPEGLSYEEATFVEPLADCLHAVLDQAKVKVGDKVVIIGAGQMGLQILMVTKLLGATAIVSELNETRLKYAENFGADYLINPLKEDPVEEVKKITKGRGADSVIISIGEPIAIEQGLRMAKRQGKVVLFGGALPGTTFNLDPNIIHYKEISLIGSYWVGFQSLDCFFNFDLFNTALELILSKKVPVSKLVTHRFSLSEIHKAFRIVERREGLKVIIIP